MDADRPGRDAGREVGEHPVGERPGIVETDPAGGGEADGEVAAAVCVAHPQPGGLQAPSPVDPDGSGPVDEDVGDRRIRQRDREITEAGELPAEVPDRLDHVGDT